MHRIAWAILLVICALCGCKPAATVPMPAAKESPAMPVGESSPSDSNSAANSLPDAAQRAAEERYIRMVDGILEESDLRSLIIKAIAAARQHKRDQFLFSLFEAGLQYGISLTIDEEDAIKARFPDADIPRSVSAEGSFDYYAVGSSRVQAKLSEIIRNLPDSEDMDFVLTTHDGVYYLDLKTGCDFEGELKFR